MTHDARTRKKESVHSIAHKETSFDCSCPAGYLCHQHVIHRFVNELTQSRRTAPDFFLCRCVHHTYHPIYRNQSPISIISRDVSIVKGLKLLRDIRKKVKKKKKKLYLHSNKYVERSTNKNVSIRTIFIINKIIILHVIK